MTKTTVSYKMQNIFKVYPDIHTVAMAVAEDLLKLSLQGQAENKILHVSLSGGSTPKKLFQLLAKEEYLKEISWKNLAFWWGDERLVPFDSEESNYGEAKRLLFDHIPSEKLNVNPAQTQFGANAVVEKYAESLDEQLDIINGVPSFDWMILGMGDDGHTASLFPDGVSLDNPNHTALAEHPTSGQKRVSLTLKVLNQSKRVSFLVTGANKAPILRDIINEQGQYKDWPTHAVKSLSNSREWYLDKAAAEFINEGKN